MIKVRKRMATEERIKPGNQPSVIKGSMQIASGNALDASSLSDIKPGIIVESMKK